MQVQPSTQPPLQPNYVLRGHSAQVHAVHFLRNNSRFLSGDADGWVVLWNVVTKRAAAVWRAHEGSILGLGDWGEENIITHGRDNSLRVWQLRSSDESHLSVTLPVDDPTAHRKQPWLLHSLNVNTLNFCSFAMCPAHPQLQQQTSNSTQQKPENSILIAVPATRDAHIDIFQLPTEKRISTVPALPLTKTNMVMALRLIHQPSHLLVLAGYESGHTAIHACHSFSTSELTQNSWSTIYLSQPHTQPILSLDVAPALQFYYTSAADAIIARHPIALPATSSPSSHTEEPTAEAAAAAEPAPAPAQPDKLIHTKHAGQQALRVRSDGKVFATAGWDARVRVYSAKTMKELAVLRWHQVGCYALAFAEVGGRGRGERVGGKEEKKKQEQEKQVEDEEGREGDLAFVGTGEALRGREVGLNVRQRREAKAQETHWLAAGSKDGKVSLWEVY